MISTASAKAFLSALKRSATWAGVVPPGTMPLWTSFSRTDGVFTASIEPSTNLSMISFGVPAGTMNPFQEPNWKPGSVSATAGRFGACGMRFGVATASSLILPLSRWGSISEALPKYMSTCPARRSPTACTPPLYGTRVMSSPARAFKIPAAMLVTVWMPTPA